MSDKSDNRKTYYESIIKQGYNRRDFLKFSTYMTAFMGLQSSMVGQIANKVLRNNS